MKVSQLSIEKDMNIIDLINQFESSGVLGAGRVARACDILADMISDEDMNVFLSLGGPLIPGGMRNIVTKMIKEGHVNLIVSSGANITHDLEEQNCEKINCPATRTEPDAHLYLRTR